jgi:hypothetical protein
MALVARGHTQRWHCQHCCCWAPTHGNEEKMRNYSETSSKLSQNFTETYIMYREHMSNHEDILDTLKYIQTMYLHM